MINFKKELDKNTLIFLSLILCSLFFSFFFEEDSLGGARHDYLFHEKYFSLFSENFTKTILDYGTSNEVRNSPVFYILFSNIVKYGGELGIIKYINLVIVCFIIIIFYKCLKIKLPDLNNKNKILLSFAILLSPTIRSLINFPYPFLWALFFFLQSIHFYLKLENSNKNNSDLKLALLCIFYLGLCSYFTPNFSVFGLFYFFKFFKKFNISKNLIKIFIFSLILSLPAIIFIVWKDFYMFKNNVYSISFFEKINFTNKIVIISTFIILFLLPLIKRSQLTKKLFIKIHKKKILSIFLVFIICAILFNFKSGAGGGIFYQFSNIFFDNNYFLILVFFISLILFEQIKLYNLQNIFLFIILILYNLQYTIYYKYFDPLIYFMIFFLFNIDKKKFYREKYLGIKFIILYFLFLASNFFKIEIKSFYM